MQPQQDQKQLVCYQVSWRRFQRSSLDVCCLSFCSLPRWFMNAEVRALGGQSMADSVPDTLFLHWQWKMNLLPTRFSPHGIALWTKIGLLFCIHISVNFDEVSNTTGWNLATIYDRAWTIDGCRPGVGDSFLEGPHEKLGPLWRAELSPAQY